MSTRAPGEHMFVVPVYGKPAWLDRCLESLRTQTTPSTILITTPTPSAYLDEVARRWGVAIEVNPVCGGIGADWNYALSRAVTPWVTLAHQDDWYAPTYLECCLETAARTRAATLIFTAAAETDADTDKPVPNCTRQATDLRWGLPWRRGDTFHAAEAASPVVRQPHPVPGGDAQ